jgi:nickel-dependent lactate racemase
LPSIAGAESVITNHGARMVGHPRARWGVTLGNPIWEEMLEAARMVKPTFLLNVAMNRDKQVTAVFAGELFEAHRAGCKFVGESAIVPVPHAFDVVLTSNSGYPLDLNLYQAVKGMSAAAQIARPGGAIIVAAECWDGVPDHGQFGRLLRESRSPAELLARVESPGFASPDQWQVQILAQIRLKANVYVRADGLSDEQVKASHLTPCSSIEGILEQLSSQKKDMSICVLPEGPITIPTLA